jgi:phosphate:Na+ symporter
MSESLQIAFGLLGGLALFLYGMTLMSDSLQKAAGEKMKEILAAVTKNAFFGVLAGALVTMVLQSSSATTVMAIGFVTAGLLKLPQAISIIFGANIGTTMTAQLIAFKLSDYIYMIIFIGFIIWFIAKRERNKAIGATIFAFGLLFLGIETMGDVMKPLATSPVFLSMIHQVAGNRFLGVAVGCLMTLVVQSSSATIAVLQNFASQANPDGVTSIIGLAGAIPILLGDNIGTTITAILASLSGSRDAKRTAAAHCIFNISGTLLFIWFVGPYAKLIQAISPKGDEVEVISRQIANAHTGFNLTMTCIWIFFVPLMVKIVCKIIPDKKGESADIASPVYLDNALLANASNAMPAAALTLIVKEIDRLGGITKNLIQTAGQVVGSDDAKGSKALKENAQSAHVLYETILNYMSRMNATGQLTEEQASHSANLSYVLYEIDRAGGVIIDICNLMQSKDEKKIVYSPQAMEGLKEYLAKAEDMYDKVLHGLQYGDLASADAAMEDRIALQELNIANRKAHIDRVNEGTCKPDYTEPFGNMLHEFDRIGNACRNMADLVRSGMNFSYFKAIEAAPAAEPAPAN